VTLSVGIEISRTVVTGAQIAVAAIIILDLVFAYSVLSNKLRIHNAHCNAEGCRGYRIKDAAGCCAKMLRCVCKLYNLIIVALVWFTVILAILLCCTACWSAGISLSLVGLCQTSRPAVDLLLEALQDVGGRVESTVVGDYITVKNGTTADAVCDEDDKLLRGSFFMLGSAPIALIAQIIMLVSYNVVAEVSWRHMKDMHRMGVTDREDVEMNGQQPSDIEMRRQQIQNSSKARGGGRSQKGGRNAAEPEVPGGFPATYPSFSDPNANWAQSAPGMPGSPYRSQGSSFQHAQHTTQDI